MRERSVIFVLLATLAIAVSLFASPSIGQADPITISSISVTVGNTTWCNTGGSCAAANQIWNLGATGITLGGGQSLILTQTGPNYNFDTSEGSLPSCQSPPCSTALSINGATVNLNGAGANVLANNNLDPGGTTHNEAANWSPASSTLIGGFGSVYFGYADNIHTGDCADPDNCLPNSGSTGPTSLWAGTSTFFLGAGVSGTGLNVVQGGANHCSVSNPSADCFDAGAILIYNTQTTVPEPSTVLLVATMVIGLTAWGFRRNRRSISLAA